MTALRSMLALVCALTVLGACDNDTTGPGTGELQVTISGLPAGVAPAVSVRGPDGSEQVVRETRTLADLPVGEYTVTAEAVAVDSTSFGVIQPEQTVVVEGGVRAVATVTYADLSAALAVRISGLPPEAEAAVRVTGPGGFERTLNGGGLIPGLAPGTYTVVAPGVEGTDSTYQAQPIAQELVVGDADPARAEVTYAPVAAAGLNLGIGAMYIVQTVQSRGGGVPLVTGRDGYLRAFVVGSAANKATPRVRVRLYHDDSLVDTYFVTAEADSTPTRVQEGSLGTSWNLFLDGDLIQPGLRVLADVDPLNGVAESDETDNLRPAGGSAAEMEVVTPPELRLRIVPVRQSRNGLTGRVDADNLQDFLEPTRKIYPIGGSDVQLRETYTTDVTLDRDGATWSLLVSELDAVRVAEASEAYYYGVVRVPYTSGVVGIAAAIGSRTSLGWDLMPYAAETLAHELGHNWGRYHAPCNGAGGADPNYPYQMGMIGAFGMDVAARELKDAFAFTDIMGYCDQVWWISDYTYENVLEYREAHDRITSDEQQPTLLVWGRIVDGKPVLEPAFQVTTRPVLPATSGPNRIEALDESGNVLFSVAFRAERIPDVEGDQRRFAFALPLEPQAMDAVSRLRLTSPMGVSEVRSNAAPHRRGPVEAMPVVSVEPAPGERVRLEWDGSTHPVVMVRNPRTGAILSFARGSTASIATSARELEIIASDGVRSTTRRVTVGGR